MLNRLKTLIIDENVKLFTAIGTKINSQKWVKKHESQVGERDKLELKVVVLHDSIGKQVHMTQLVRFTAKDLVQLCELSGAHLNELCVT